MGNHMLLACGIAAGPVFTLAYLLEGARRKDYKPLRHPVSSLALGPAGWVQTANFLTAGLLSLAFAVGLWNAGPSRVGAVLMGVWALGLVGAGAFRTDPVSGYPADTPHRIHDHTRAGALQLFAATMVVAGAAFGQNPRVAGAGGLIQRISVSIGWGWVVVLAARVLHA